MAQEGLGLEGCQEEEGCQEKVYGGPSPLVSAHIVHIQLGRPTQLTLGRFCCRIHSRRVTAPPAHNLVVHRLPTGLLKGLHIIDCRYDILG